MLNGCPTEIDFDFYKPRNPKASAYCRCVEDQIKDGTSTKTFDALDWLAQLVTHIPKNGESAGGGVRYYGFYSNKSRGLRKKLVLDLDRGAGTDDQVSS